MRRVTQREHRRAIALLHRLADKAMRRALHRALAPAIARLRSRHLALTADATDELSGFDEAWVSVVDDELKPMLEEAFGLGALGAARQLGPKHAAAVAAISGDVGQLDVADFVSAARLRWVANTEPQWAKLGADVWGKAKQELLDGISQGESVDQLAERLSALGDIAGTLSDSLARSMAVASANAGSFTEVKALGADGPGGRMWIATLDDRTRPAHADADGLVVAMDEPFIVDGEELDYPGDPAGSDENTISCRCSIGYTDEPPEEGAANLPNITMQLPTDESLAASLTAAAEQHTGGMVALVPTEADAQRLAVDGYEPPDVLHCTLAFLGDGATLPDVTKTEVLGIAAQLAAQTEPIVANAHGVALFNAASDEPCAVWLMGDTDLLGPRGVPPLQEVHDRLWGELEDYGTEGFPEQHSPFVPHIAGAYSNDLTPLLSEAGTEVTFDRLRVAFGTEDVTDYPLAAGDTVPVTGSGEEPTMSMTDEQAMTIGEKVGASLVTALGLGTATGNGTASTVTLAVGDAPPPATPAPADAPAPDATAPEDEASEPEEFHILMVTEEQATLEKPARFFAAQCFDWREPPFPLMWLATDMHSEGDPAPSVQVGLITRVERQGLEIHGYGVWDDPENMDACEARRRVENGMLRWNSVDIGDVGESDIELVFPPPGTVAPDGIEVTQPDQITFHHGRIVLSTLVFAPAQESAQIEPLIYATDEMGMEPMMAAAVAVHHTATADDTWDGGAAEANLPSPMTVATGRDFYAWIDESQVDADGMMPKAAGKFGHHDTGADGNPGAANLTACSSGIGVLNGGRGGTTIPDADVQGVYNHLAAHLSDAGKDVPPLAALDGTLTAAAYAVQIPDVPDDAWFDQPPREMLRRGCLTITDEGRVYGLLAPGAVPHVGLSERRTVPLHNVDYRDFLRGETPVRLADGTVGRRVTGNLTMACGHASPTLPNGATVAHYDNSCSLFATANCGEANGDVWVAGALLPGVDADQVRRAMACQLSGHWNPHELARGRYSLLAGLLVPIPGFPKGRSEATATTRWGPNDDGDLMLVASAVPVVFEQTAPAGPVLASAAERIARSVGLDRESRVAAVRASAAEIAERVGLDRKARAERIAARVQGVN